MVETEAMTEPAPAKKFQFVGGELCLDFCNTVGGKRGGVARENLHTYADFLSWSEQVGLVNHRQAEAMANKASRSAAEAEAVLGRAILLREGIYRIFLALIESKKPKAADLATLNSELAATLGRLRVARPTQGSGFAWEWADGDQLLDHPLGPIARSAADLLTHAKLLNRVSQCGGDNCGWLFVDASKNHSRCWCDMRDCGNRAKIRRYRMKQRT
jgi:predicted RNA-binding Zn ribbon-like protein